MSQLLVEKREKSPALKKPQLVRLGGVAYSPDSVNVFRGIRHYCLLNDFSIDYVLYSNYDALVKALRDGQIDIAWNSPLAHAKYHLQSGGRSQVLAMRDIDRNFRCLLLARKDSGINSLTDLPGKTIVFGSCDSAEATVLPIHYLKKAGVTLDAMNVLSLHDEVDRTGCPCHSEQHVLEALQQGRAHAGLISQVLWKHLQAEQPDVAGKFQLIWTSPPFSHCVFTARADFDKALAARFTQLMLAMDDCDPLTAEVLRLEQCQRWVPGTHEGYETLLQALSETAPCDASV